MTKFVIIGSGIAGVTLAKQLAEHSVPVTLVDRSADGLYAKMRLPDALSGKLPVEKLILSSPEALRSLGIATEFGTEVLSIDHAEKQITLAGGKVLSYDKLILATGADAGLPPIPGAVPGMTLRTFEDLKHFLPQARNAKNAVVIGGGLLGLEAAHALKSRGIHVEIIECMNRLLPRQLNEKESALLLEMFRASGYGVHLGCSTAQIDSTAGAPFVTVGDSEVLPADLILISAGIRPSCALARGAGIGTNRGILVNNRFETSAPDVYAIGDCAELNGVVYGLWSASKDHGMALAEILLGMRDHFDPPVYEPVLKIPGVKLQTLREQAAGGGVSS